MGEDPERSWRGAWYARRTGERDGAARGGGRRLSRGAGGTYARAGSARLGGDAEQPRHRACRRLASGRAGRRGSRRRSQPIVRRCRSKRASGFRSSGRGRRTISAMRSKARRAGERDGAARGGGRRLSRGAGGKDARAGSARLGGDAEQSRHCARSAWRAGERDGAARGGGRGLSRGAGGTGRASGFRSNGRRRRTISAARSRRSASGRAGRRGSKRRSRPIARRWRNDTRERVPLQWALTQMNLGIALEALGERESGTARLEEAVDAYRAALEELDARAGSASMGEDADESRHCALEAWRAGERDGAARGGGRGLSRGAAGADTRAGSARLGDDAEQSWQCARELWASGRAARRGSRRRSRPIARRWRNTRASGFRSTGRGASAIRESP